MGLECSTWINISYDKETINPIIVGKDKPNAEVPNKCISCIQK